MLLRYKQFESYWDRIFYHGSAYTFDKFDMSKVGSGDGKNKYGFGLYFSDNEDTARYYFRELGIGKQKKTAKIYSVRLKNVDDYVGWEDEISDDLLQKVIKKLNSKMLYEDAEEIERENNEYGLWSFRSLYEHLSVILDGQKQATDFLNSLGVSGTFVKDDFHKGNIYVAYSDEDVKIIE